MDNLDNHPQIVELMNTLEENEMHKEREEVQSLVDYIGDMETTLTGMLKEMQSMRQEINLIHNNSLKAKCQNLVQTTEGKIKQATAVVTKVKNNLIQSAKNALQVYREKGKSALRKTVKAMKIPETLDKLSSLFNRLSKETQQSYSQVNEMQSELNSAKGHFKNVGRLLIGRSTTEAEQVKSDKGVLSRFGKLLSKMSAGFDRLSQKAMDASDKIRVDHVKESVRSELNTLKSINKVSSIADPARER